MLLKKVNTQSYNKSAMVVFLTYAMISLFLAPFAAYSNEESVKITKQQAKALKMLNRQEASKHQVKNLRVHLEKLSDNQGQIYLGAIVTRADLSGYLTQLKGLLKGDFKDFRAKQAARDHHSFHMTLLSPKEYQVADKALIEKLLSANVGGNLSQHLNVTLLGLGKVEQECKSTFFVVAQSSDAQLIRQKFLLPAKDFHVTLGFNPNDIYGVKKDRTTLIE